MRTFHLLTFVVASIWLTPAFAQEDSLLNLLMQEDKQEQALLPPKMLITQRALWGEKGLMRVTGISPLNKDQRKKEMGLRRAMLVTHQALGFITLGEMVAQGIVGSQLYKGNYRLKDIHEGLATGINITYSLGAVTSFLAPPPLVNRDKKISSLRLHKWLSIVHMSGMIATNILAEKAEDPKWKAAHRAAAFTAFAGFAAAMIVIKF